MLRSDGQELLSAISSIRDRPEGLFAERGAVRNFANESEAATDLNNISCAEDRSEGMTADLRE
jgi:hypothetical protein